METLGDQLSRSRILIVDDTPLNVTLLQEALAGHQCHVAGTGEQALRMLAGEPRPDLVLLDVMMPGIDGFEVLRRIKASPAHREIPVIFITALGGVEDETRGIMLGAVDYITKPFNAPVVRARVRTHLLLALARTALAHQNDFLEAEVARRTAQLAEVLVGLKHASLETILRLARASEFKDEDTGTHLLRMSNYAAALARRMGLLPDEVERLLHAAPMHDVGKIGVPDYILRKEGKLTAGEWEIMRQHTDIGAQILSGSRAEVIRLGEIVAWSHHERWDGTGYPRRLKGAEIPLPGRIVAAADVFDALTSKRPYREPLTLDQALALIRQDTGTHFDPDVVTVLVAARDELAAIRDRFGTGSADSPAVAGEAAAPAAAPAPAAQSTAAPRARILVVDDDEISRTILATVLEDEGHEVLQAGCGEDALAVIERGIVDLVLSDVMMPGMDGFDLCRRIRGGEKQIDLPVVFITSLEDKDSRVLGKEAGCDDFLCKPLDRIELLARVRNLLRVKAYHDLLARQQEMLTRELEGMQAPLLHIDRLATLGTLATGVGHELLKAAAQLGGTLAGAESAGEAGQGGLPAVAGGRVDLPGLAALLTTHAQQLLNLGRTGPEAIVECDLRDVVGRTLDMLRIAGRTREVAIERFFPAEPLPVCVHRTRIEQVVVNLVENAVDAVRDGGRGPAAVRISLAAAAGRVLCRVEDEGCGMAADTLGKIFEPYFSTKPEGNGLGLTVVKGIVTAAGGAVTVESRPGEGTAVGFDLPLVAPSG